MRVCRASIVNAIFFSIVIALVYFDKRTISDYTPPKKEQIVRYAIIGIITSSLIQWVCSESTNKTLPWIVLLLPLYILLVFYLFVLLGFDFNIRK